MLSVPPDWYNDLILVQTAVLEYKLFTADSAGPSRDFIGLDAVENTQKRDEGEARVQKKNHMLEYVSIEVVCEKLI